MNVGNWRVETESQMIVQKSSVDDLDKSADWKLTLVRSEEKSATKQKPCWLVQLFGLSHLAPSALNSYTPVPDIAPSLHSPEYVSPDGKVARPFPCTLPLRYSPSYTAPFVYQ